MKKGTATKPKLSKAAFECARHLLPEGELQKIFEPGTRWVVNKDRPLAADYVKGDVIEVVRFAGITSLETRRHPKPVQRPSKRGFDFYVTIYDLDYLEE